MDFGAYTPLRAESGNHKKVAIVGFCETSREFTPYEDPDFEIWGLNRGSLFMPITPQVTRWFEMHGEHIVSWQNRRPGKHVEWLNNFPGPVYMHQQYEWCKTSVEYPLQLMADYFGKDLLRVGHMTKTTKESSSGGGPIELMESAGPNDLTDATGEPYLSSSIAYELALAIYEGFEEIHLYGVDLVTDAEYAWQKPGVEYLLGFALGKGIRVVLPANCPLLRGTLYGRGFLSERPEEMSYEQLAARQVSLTKQAEKVHIAIAQVQGAHTNLVQFVQAQMLPGIDHEKTEARRKDYENQIQQLTFQLQQLQGGIQETAYWIHQTMQGQSPTEAIEQLRKLKDTELVAEGPTNDLEEMQHADYDRQNGVKPPELIPA